jgi:hypothetical protein
MSTTELDVQNSSDQIIRVEIPSANFNKFISANAIEPVTLNLGQTYNFKLTKGRVVKNTKYVYNNIVTLAIYKYDG